MEISEKLAYCYWELLATTKVIDRLKNKGILSDDEYIQDLILKARDRLGLEESIEQLMDKSYLDKTIRGYGRDMESSPIPIFKAMDTAYQRIRDCGITGTVWRDLCPPHYCVGFRGVAFAGTQV